jgi:RNA polymerase sigma-70 factor, ECF subfamily
VAGSGSVRMSPELAERFEREALPHRDQLLRAALLMTRHRQDAEELVQEAITRACAGFDRFTPGSNIKAWLNRILLNAFINGYRKRQREPLVMTSEPEQIERFESIKSLPSLTASAEDSVLATMPDGKLVEAIRELPVGFRQVLYLIDVEGFTYRETAAIMSTPVGTVMSRLHRARNGLRTRLSALGDGQDGLLRGREEMFEERQRGERAGNQFREVPHVQRDGGPDHRGCGHSHRLDHLPRNDQKTSAAPSGSSVLNMTGS